MDVTLRMQLEKEDLKDIVFYFGCPFCDNVTTTSPEDLAPPFGWPECEDDHCVESGPMEMYMASIKTEL